MRGAGAAAPQGRPGRVVAVAATLWLAALAGCPWLSPGQWSDRSGSGLGEIDAAQIRSLLEEARYGEAEASARWLIEVRERAEGPRSLDVALALDLYVWALLGAGKASEDEIEKLAFRAMDIKEELLAADEGVREEEVDLGASLTNLGRIYVARGDPETARPYLERAIADGEATYGPGHPSLVLAYRNLGNALKANGELEAAEAAYLKESGLIVSHRGPDHLDLAANAYNTAWLLIDLGDFLEAGKLFERARAIVEENLGADSPRMVWVLLGLGVVRDLQGDYVAAIEAYERALEIAKDSLGPEHPMVASAETGLGSTLMEMGDYRKARAALLRSLELLERTYGPEHENTGRTLRNLAEVSFELDDVAAAEDYLDRALEVFESSGADYLTLEARVLEAESLAERGMRAEATKQLREVLESGEIVIPDHLDLVQWEDALGDVLLEAGRYQESEAAYLSATRRAERLMGEHDPDHIAGLLGLATARARGGEPDSALEVAVRSEELSMGRARFLAASLPERQALRVTESRPSATSLLITLATSQGGEDTTWRAWNAVVRSRAAVLDELAFRQRLFASGRLDSELARDYLTANRRLANLKVRGAMGGDPRGYRGLVEAAERRREAAEKGVALATGQYRWLKEQRRVGIDSVIDALPAGSALVSYAVYRHDRAAASADSGEEERYAAFVSTGSDRPPRIVPLGAAETVDAAVADWRGAVRGGLSEPEGATELAYWVSAGRVRELVWDPIARYLDGSTTLFVVPDGKLQLINLAALPSDISVPGRTEYLVEHFSFHHLSSERDIIGSPREVEGSGLLAVGGADYHDFSQFALLRSPEDRLARVSHESTENFRGSASDCRALGRVEFRELPGTDSEVLAISALWSEMAGEAAGAALLLRGGEASEQRFKSEAPGHAVVHLATHGFFLGGECPSPDVGQRGIGGLSAVDTPEWETPLRLSGLALAGANLRGSALPEEEDGILTALEIAAVDLRGVSWAVLSGCDTGVGEIRTGEGVFGMRRAFRASGVETLIMSLWPVRDEATFEWMQALYQERLERKQDTVSAVTHASRRVLKRRRQEGESTHPAFWGGFVASGEWR